MIQPINYINNIQTNKLNLKAFNVNFKGVKSDKEDKFISNGNNLDEMRKKAEKDIAAQCKFSLFMLLAFLGIGSIFLGTRSCSSNVKQDSVKKVTLLQDSLKSANSDIPLLFK